MITGTTHYSNAILFIQIEMFTLIRRSPSQIQHSTNMAGNRFRNFDYLYQLLPRNLSIYIRELGLLLNLSVNGYSLLSWPRILLKMIFKPMQFAGFLISATIFVIKTI